MKTLVFSISIIIFFLLPFLFILAMVSPTWINKRIKHNFSRLKYAKFIGLGLGVAFIAIMFTVPPTDLKVEQSSITPSPTTDITSNNTSTTDANTIPLPNEEVQTVTSRETAKVTRIIDGDTIELEGGKRVRYIGIDTPEMSPVECYARQAFDKNSALVLNRTVELEKDVSETDKYGRLLRYIWIDGQLINEILVSEGFAHASTYPPDIKFQERFRIAQSKAQEGENGLWGNVCFSLSPTPQPTSTPITKQATPIPTIKPTSGGSTWGCDCSKSCTEITSCVEAQYQLNNCKCKARDSDKDGIACDGSPLHCQN